jgi:hypothetical protein
LREFADCPEVAQKCERYGLLLGLGEEPADLVEVCDVAPRVRCRLDGCQFEADAESRMHEHLASHAESLVKAVVVYMDPLATVLDVGDLISRVLAHSCRRCARFDRSRGCPLYGECKAGRSLGVAIHFEPRDAVRREIYECRWGCKLQGRVRALEHLLGMHRHDLYTCE